MAEVEELAIVIDVLDEYTDELLDLLALLEVVDAVAEKVDTIRIDVEVNDRELDTLLAKLASVQMAAMPDVNVDVDRRGMAMGGGAGVSDELVDMFAALDDTLRNALSGRGGGRSNMGGAMRGASEAAEEAGGLFGGLNLRMTDMHNALAKLIPVLFVFIGALPAVITGLVAVAAAAISAAAALGAIGAFGLIGLASMRGGGGMPSMDEFSDIFSDIAGDFFTAFQPLFQQLAPLMQRGLDGLEKFFTAIANQGGALLALRDEAVAFGEFLMDFVPGALANMARLAEAFGPTFAMFGDFLGEMNFLEGLASVFADMLPDFMEFLDITIRLIPAIVDLSVGFLHIANAIARFVMFVGGVIRFFLTLNGLLPVTDQMIGVLMASILTLITVIAILNSQMMVNLMGNLRKFAFTTVPNAVGALSGYISGLNATTAASFIAANATRVLTAAIIGLLAVTGIGLLVSAIGLLAGQFIQTSTAIDDAASSLRNFDRLARSSSNNPYGAGQTELRARAGEGSGGVLSRGGSATFNFAPGTDKETVASARRSFGYYTDDVKSR